MSIPFIRRTLVFLLLALALTVSAASAGQTSASPRGLAAAKAASLDILGRLWNLFTGCMIDPDGRCLGAPTLPATQGDTGCYIDPDGRSAPQPVSVPAPMVQGDSGCYIDPSGRCRG